MQTSIQQILALLRIATKGSRETLQNPLDWQGIYDIAAKHQLLGQLHKAIEAIPELQRPSTVLQLQWPADASADIPFIPEGMSTWGRNFKRIQDVVISGLCLIVFFPLFLITYLLIKIEDGGPAIYKQERVGRYGQPFYIYKFRSMTLDAEDDGPSLCNADETEDQRLTKVGKFIRAHHLDELPQLWNVFCGDMAFIGYRPERQFFIDKIVERDPRYIFLYQMRPGVTSYATLYNGYTDTIEKMIKRLEYDLYYLQQPSWTFDIRILWNTFISIVFGKKF